MAIVTFLIDAVLDASRARPFLVALFAGLLAVGARVLDLASLCLELGNRNDASSRPRKVGDWDRSWWWEGYRHSGTT